jgi:hypothetical protein
MLINRVVPRRLDPEKIRLGATKVEAQSSAPITPQEQTIIVRLTPRPEVAPRAESPKGESTPREKSHQKHTRNNTFDTPLQSTPAPKEHRTRRSAGDKERQALKPPLKKTSPRIFKPDAPTGTNQSAEQSPRTPKGLGQSEPVKTSPRFVVPQRSSPRISPRFKIGSKQQPSALTLPREPDQPSGKPSQGSALSIPEETLVQRHKAFFEKMLQPEKGDPPLRKPPVPLTRSATVQGRGGKVAKLTQSTGFSELRSTKPDFHF